MHLPLDGLDFLTWLDLGLSILIYFLNSVTIRKKNKQTRKNKENTVVCINER